MHPDELIGRRIAALEGVPYEGPFSMRSRVYRPYTTSGRGIVNAIEKMPVRRMLPRPIAQIVPSYADPLGQRFSREIGARDINKAHTQIRNMLRPNLPRVTGPLGMSRTNFTTIPSSLKGPVARNTVYRFLARGAGSIGSLAARVGPRALAALGPIGMAILAAATVGTVGYHVYKKFKTSHDLAQKQTGNLMDALLPKVDDSVKLPKTPSVVPKKVADVAPATPDFSGNIPWQRRPGKNATLRELFQMSPVLVKYFGNVHTF